MLDIQNRYQIEAPGIRAKIEAPGIRAKIKASCQYLSIRKHLPQQYSSQRLRKTSQ
jgi:hypothetical protein